MHVQKRLLIIAALIWAMIVCCSKCEFESTTSSGIHRHRLKCFTYQNFTHDRQNLHHKISQSKKAKTLRQSQQGANVPHVRTVNMLWKFDVFNSFQQMLVASH